MHPTKCRREEPPVIESAFIAIAGAIKIKHETCKQMIIYSACQMWHGSQQQADTSLHQCLFPFMSGLLKIEDCISRWSSLFPSDYSPESDSFNVNKAIHISLAAQPRHQQQLGFTNIKHSCRVIAPHFRLSWTVHVALDCLFITNYTFTMATQ